MYTIEAAYIFSIILLVIGSLVTSAIKLQSKIANSHFLRTAGTHSPDSPGHIKRTVLEISRAERGLRPANQYRALSQKAMPSQSVR